MIHSVPIGGDRQPCNRGQRDHPIQVRGMQVCRAGPDRGLIVQQVARSIAKRDVRLRLGGIWQRSLRVGAGAGGQGQYRRKTINLMRRCSDVFLGYSLFLECSLVRLAGLDEENFIVPEWLISEETELYPDLILILFGRFRRGRFLRNPDNSGRIRG